jgi:hypothetical protein
MVRTAASIAPLSTSHCRAAERTLPDLFRHSVIRHSDLILISGFVIRVSAIY